MTNYFYIIAPVIVLAGFAIGYFFAKKLNDVENKKLKNTADDILAKARLSLIHI